MAICISRASKCSGVLADGKFAKRRHGLAGAETILDRIEKFKDDDKVEKVEVLVITESCVPIISKWSGGFQRVSL